MARRLDSQSKGSSASTALSCQSTPSTRERKSSTKSSTSSASDASSRRDGDDSGFMAAAGRSRIGRALSRLPPRVCLQRPSVLLRRLSGAFQGHKSAERPEKTGAAQVEPGTVLQIDADSGELLCYELSSLTRETDASDQEDSTRSQSLVLRLPLYLASAGLVQGSTCTVHVTLPTPEAKEDVASLQLAPGDAHSTFQGESVPAQASGVWLFECQEPTDALQFMMELQLAGCVMQGLCERYRLMRQVGHGSFGRVFMAKDHLTGKRVAIKVFSHNAKVDEHSKPVREAIMMRRVSHPNLLEFLGLYEVSETDFQELGIQGAQGWAIVTEYLCGGDLHSFIDRRGPLPVAVTQSIARQLLSALDALHSHGVIHKDIKLENVMITGKGNEVKLVDFGLAALAWDQQLFETKVGSAGYVPPELWKPPDAPEPKLEQNFKADCFSLGCLLYTCAAGRGPFAGKNTNDTLARNKHCAVRRDGLASLPECAHELVMKLLAKSPTERPTAAECLRHPWLLEAADGASSPFDRQISKDSEAPSVISYKSEVSMSTAPSNLDLPTSLPVDHFVGAMCGSEASEAQKADVDVEPAPVVLSRPRRKRMLSNMSFVHKDYCSEPTRSCMKAREASEELRAMKDTRSGTIRNAVQLPSERIGSLSAAASHHMVPLFHSAEAMARRRSSSQESFSVLVPTAAW